MNNENWQLTADAIVALNRLKIKKVDGMDLEQINDLQRHLESELGASATELDETYSQ